MLSVLVGFGQIIMLCYNNDNSFYSGQVLTMVTRHTHRNYRDRIYLERVYS